MSEPIYLSREVGVPLLKFLWRWKVVSTAGLAQRFFPDLNPISAYNRLLHLKHHHYVAMRKDEQGQYALWSLDRAGFKAIRDLLPPLREEGYRSEAPYHDWLASAFHMGEWLNKLPSGVQVFSEQELRRIEAEDYPDWVPKSREHRSDGYWHRASESGSRTVALEMELTRKKAALYRSVGSFYGESAQVNRALWVVRTLTDAKRIKESLDQGMGSRPGMHSFVRLDSFLKQGWSAQVEHGAGGGLRVTSFLQMALDFPESDRAVTSHDRGHLTALLETRIRPNPISPFQGFRCGRFFPPDR